LRELIDASLKLTRTGLNPLKLEIGFASRALPKPTVPLKDRFTFFLNARRAQIMQGVIVAGRFAQAIHNRTGWRFPKLVAIKLGLKSLALCEILLQRRKLELQVRIRHLRVCYLHSQLAHRKFDLRISRRLRSLEKSFDRFGGFGNFAGGTARVPGKIDNGVQTLEIEFQNLLRLETAFRDRKAKFEHSGMILPPRKGSNSCTRSDKEEET